MYKLDLKSSYNQIIVDKLDQHKTVVSSPSELIQNEFTCMPFGLIPLQHFNE